MKKRVQMEELPARGKGKCRKALDSKNRGPCMRQKWNQICPLPLAPGTLDFMSQDITAMYCEEGAR